VHIQRQIELDKRYGSVSNIPKQHNKHTMKLANARRPNQ